MLQKNWSRMLLIPVLGFGISFPRTTTKVAMPAQGAGVKVTERYRLFVPSHIDSARPLLVMIHGCKV
jgi:poly(3-hydroxybutyrate) depolymerase